MSELNIPSSEISEGSATGNLRNKVSLKKGRGLMDWVRLTNSNKDISCTGGKILKITLEELSKHNTRNDAWIAINGNVYNITPYFEYHPGGEEELLRGVGIDATNLFNEVHKWVNYESLLKKCVVGQLNHSKSLFSRVKLLPTLTATPKSQVPSNSRRFPSFPKISLNPSHPSISGFNWKPKYDWFQTESTVNIVIYTKWKNITEQHLIVVCIEKEIKIYTYIKAEIFIVNIELHKPVQNDAEVCVANTSGKVDVIFKKLEQNVQWSTIGISLSSDNKFFAINSITIDYYAFKISNKTKITHDTYLYEVVSENVLHFGVPIGFHVFLGLSGIDIKRPYTPIIFPIYENSFQCFKTIKFFIKIYPDGIFTAKLENLCESDTLEVGIPQGSFSILEQQRISNLANLLILAAGTGITPFPAIISFYLKMKVFIKLIFFNKMEEDIAWREDFDKMEESESFTVVHVLSQANDNWKGRKGRVTKELIQDELQIGTDFVCICGPKQFNDLCKQLLEELGVPEKNMHSFCG